ncbi:MAG: phenylalanine--tRNA ligase subunit beta [Bacteroidales bacterium]|nr:phenylalanine--tRNA ligase subunit beta [Bacteroidales bacterium]
MKISYKWLKDLMNFSLTAEETAAILTDCGLEVEGVETFETVRGGLRGLKIGEVLTCEPHPNSDHLHVTTVNVGDPEPLHIVCGAPNVAAGQKVVVATIGTVLYSGDESFTIKKSKLRGEPSEGMICAEDEIGLGTSHDGIMVLPEEAVPGTPAAEYFHVESDTIFEIGLTPNRCDAICHFGVARDLYAALSQRGIPCSTLVRRNAREVQPVSGVHSRIDIVIENTTDCPRYSGVLLEGINVKESPEWLQTKLKSVGVRPINNIVDITQFIMLEYGQPMHAFDADKIEGNKVIVKNLPEGTPFVTLDGNEVKLSAADLMICNEKEGMCIAGVYGGLHSGITANTTRLFLESAYFNPVSIRKTAKRHGLKTDASFRYERGCDPTITVYALKRAVELVMDLAGGYPVMDIVDRYPNIIAPCQITLYYDEVNQVAGKVIEKKTVTRILELLDMEVKPVGEDKVIVTVPQNKVDVTRPIDLIEEILRIYGYNNIEIPTTLNYDMSCLRQNDGAYQMQISISKYLADNGFYEVMNNSLTKAEYAEKFDFLDERETVKLLNPLSSELNAMRQTLLFSGLENVARNVNNKAADLRIFEFGKTYHFNPQTVVGDDVTIRYQEKEMMSMFVTGKLGEDDWSGKAAEADFFYLRNMIDNFLQKINFPMEKMTLVTDDEPRMFAQHVAYRVGELTPVRVGVLRKDILRAFDIKKSVYYAEIEVKTLNELIQGRAVSFQPINTFPAVRRDLALVVDKTVNYDTLEKIARKYASKLLKQVSLFDVYEGSRVGEGQKSYALNFVLQSADKTLTDEEINKVMNKLISAYEREIGAKLR